MRIHHLAFRTANLPRLEKFYVEVLGLRPSHRDGDRSTWLDAGGTMLMLEQRSAAEPPPPAGSHELVAFEIVPAEAAAYAARLHEAGASIEARTAYTIYFRDPEGRRLGLSSYPEPLGR